MLKVPDHQVAGHRAGQGKIGALVDDSGRFYKPLQSDDRGSKEVGFYTQFSADTEIPVHIRKFFPIFHGTQLVEASDRSGQLPHLVLEDIAANRANPSVMDIKIGSRTWYPEASEDYITKCLKKDRNSTSVALGFRISGLQVFRGEKTGFWKPEKKRVQGYNPNDVRMVLRKFVSSNASDDFGSEPDCDLAGSVYGGSNGILAQLLKLKAWFEEQTVYHFYSCSVLVVYEKGPIPSPWPVIKLVDFAHVIDGQGVIDHNFLGGLCSLIKFITEILQQNPSKEKPETGCACVIARIESPCN